MEKLVLQCNAIPSYVHIDVNQIVRHLRWAKLYFQVLWICRPQANDCNKCAKDFPVLFQNQYLSVRNPNSFNRQYDDKAPKRCLPSLQ